MKMPIIIVEGSTLFCFDSVESAESWLEPQDVQAGEYVAYDSAGNQLHLGTKWVKGIEQFLWFSWNIERQVVYITEDETKENDATGLTHILKNDLLRLGQDPNWVETADLGELIEVEKQIRC